MCCGTGEEGDVLQTQKAIDQLDLPHDYDEVNRDSRVCICGRQKTAELHLHTTQFTEQAAAVLQTEKGS